MITEREAYQRIARRDVDVGPLRIQRVEAEPLFEGSRTRADLMVELEWEGRRQRFLVECKSTSTPKQLRAATAQAQGYAREHPSLRPMVVVPYLSREDVDYLISQEVSGIDLSGNYAIVVPGEWLVVRADRPNRFPASRPIKKIYQGTSSLVGRVFFNVPAFSLVKHVREEIERRGGSISLGTVSKVLKSLEDELIIRRDPTIKLLQPERLLDKLAESYERPEAREKKTGKSRLDPSFFENLLRSAGRVGHRVIGRSEARYAVAGESDRRLTIYTTGMHGLTEDLDFEETSRFANVELLEISGEPAFFDAREEEGFRWCSPLQIYLELASGGKRERETAQQIRKDLLGSVREKLDNRK